jgi:hypothetical protein
MVQFGLYFPEKMWNRKGYLFYGGSKFNTRKVVEDQKGKRKISIPFAKRRLKSSCLCSELITIPAYGIWPHFLEYSVLHLSSHFPLCVLSFFLF